MSLQWLSAFPEAQTSVQNMQIWYIYSTLLNFFYITLSDLFIHAQEKIRKYFCMLGITEYPKCVPCIFISFLDSIYNQTSLEWLEYAIKAQPCNRLICSGYKSNLKSFGCHVRIWCFSKLSYKQMSVLWSKWWGICKTICWTKALEKHTNMDFIHRWETAGLN